MGELDNYVLVQITQDTIGLRRLGFGVINILSHDATFPERSRLYTAQSGARADGFAVGGPEDRALAAIFAQSPHPPLVMISRVGGTKPTRVFTFTPTVVIGATYELRFRGPGFDATISYVAETGDTATDIVAALLAAGNAVAGRNYTITGTTTLVATSTAAGDWFSAESLDRGLFATVVESTAAPAGLAAELDAIALATPDFYAPLPLFGSEAYLTVVADWVELNNRILIGETSDTGSLAAPGDGGFIDTLATETYSRSAGMFHPQPAEFAAAAWYGRVLPLEVGSETWFGKPLTGVAPVALSPTERANLVNKNGNSYEQKAGRGVTFNGTTGDGDFIDVQRGIDWLVDEMSKAVAEVLFTAPTKVPYTDKGVARVEGAMRGVLRRAVNRELLDESIDPPSPSVEVPKVLDIPPSTRAQRRLPDLKFNGRLQGAIHKAEIRGILSV